MSGQAHNGGYPNAFLLPASLPASMGGSDGHPSCENGLPLSSSFDYNALCWFSGIVWIFYGVVFLTSPFGFVPIEGMYKYLWGRFEAGLKEGVDGRGDYDNKFTKGMTLGAGGAMVQLGLFFIWASSNDNYEDFNFFIVAIIGWALQLAIFVYTLVGGGWQIPKVAGWGVGFTACLALSIVVQIQNDNDFKQLSSKYAEDGSLDAGGVLYFFAVFALFGGVVLFVTSFEKFEEYGMNFYLSEEGSNSNFSRQVMRVAAAVNIALGLIYLWAAVNFDEDVNIKSSNGDFSIHRDEDFPLMLVFAVHMLPLFVMWGIPSIFVNEDDVESFAIFTFSALFGSQLAVWFTMWKMSCFP
jgi:hypothetical protein